MDAGTIFRGIRGIFIGVCCTIAIFLVLAVVKPKGININHPMHVGYGSCEAQGIAEGTDQLEEFPFKCGLQEIPSKAEHVRVFAYTQKGAWCWSNAGIIYDELNKEITLIDVLTDPKQTRIMLDAVRREITQDATLKNLIYTHCDIDHWAGQQVVYDVAENVYGGEKCADAMRAWNPKYGSRAPEKLSGKNMLTFHLVWKLIVEPLVSLLGSPLELVNRLPVKMRDGVATAMAMMSTAENLSPFDFFNVEWEEERYPKTVVTQQTSLSISDSLIHLIPSPVASHSDHDMIVHVPFADVVFAGDIAFVGTTPIVWAGKFRDCVTACDFVANVGAEYYVPGHGAITNKEYVSYVLKPYWQHLEAKYLKECDIRSDAEACAEKVCADLPQVYTMWNDPTRCVINVMVHHAKVTGEEVKGKFAFMIKQQHYRLFGTLGNVTEAAQKGGHAQQGKSEL